MITVSCHVHYQIQSKISRPKTIIKINKKNLFFSFIILGQITQILLKKKSFYISRQKAKNVENPLKMIYDN